MNAAQEIRGGGVPVRMTWFRTLQGMVARRRGEILSSAGMFTTPAVNLVYGILVVRFLDPEMAGLVSSAGLLPVYLTFLHFGVLNGMQRELPFALGAGDRERATRILKASTFVSRAAGILGAVICAGAGLISLAMGKPVLLMLAYFGSAFGALAYQVTAQIDTGLRAENRFMRQGWAVIGSSLISLATCALIPLAGAMGAVIRGVLSSLGALLVRMRTGVWMSGGGWDRTEVRSLTRVGLPLLISGTLGSLMMVSDRTVVAMMMTHRDLGEFSLAALIVNSMTLVPISMSMVMFPKIARAYGEHRSRRRLRRYVWISLAFNAAMLVPISLVCFFLIGPLVHNYFPKYASGIPAAHLACVTCVFWVYLGVGSVIGVINRMTPYLCFFAVCLAVIFGLSALLIHFGYGIMGAAWARLAGTVLMCVYTIGYSLYLTSDDDEPREVNVAP